jgi:hypothetical protein
MNEARQEELNREHKKVPPKTTNAALVSFESLMGSSAICIEGTQRFLEMEGQNYPRLETQNLTKALVDKRTKSYVLSFNMLRWEAWIGKTSSYT